MYNGVLLLLHSSTKLNLPHNRNSIDVYFPITVETSTSSVRVLCVSFLILPGYLVAPPGILSSVEDVLPSTFILTWSALPSRFIIFYLCSERFDICLSNNKAKSDTDIFRFLVNSVLELLCIKAIHHHLEIGAKRRMRTIHFEDTINFNMAWISLCRQNLVKYQVNIIPLYRQL